MKLTKDNNLKTLSILVLIMLCIKLYDIIFSPNHIYPGRTAVFSFIEIILVAALGTIGVKLAERIKLPSMWNNKLSKTNIILKPYLIGVGLGIIFLLFDSIFRVGDISVGWPLSPVFYLWGAVSQEIISHFFPIALFVFIVSDLMLRKKYNKQVYWIGAVLLSLVGGLGMASAFQNPDIPLNANYTFIPLLIGSLVFTTELIIFKILRRYGFISALFTRLGFYSIWHILWPLIFYA